MDDLILLPPTARQLDVLRLMAQGYTGIEIGEKLCLAPDTVRSHKQNLYLRWNIDNGIEAVVLALDAGLLSLEESAAAIRARMMGQEDRWK